MAISLHRPLDNPHSQSVSGYSPAANPRSAPALTAIPISDRDTAAAVVLLLFPRSPATFLARQFSRLVSFPIWDKALSHSREMQSPRPSWHQKFLARSSC